MPAYERKTSAENDRRKEVINTCLDHFIVNGLMETSTRSLSAALQLQNAGLYYYFSSKDEAVAICADEAVLRLERALIIPFVSELGKSDKMMSNLKVRADEMAPTMRFLVAVCSNKRYMEAVLPKLSKLDQRYGRYTEVMAQRLGCRPEEIEPYVYMLITSVSCYMIFGDEEFMTPQMKIAEEKFAELLEKRSQSKGCMEA